ncbi:MAG: Ig-like domain-containing protein [Candidatus Cryptobacteroides sp.]
MKMKYKFAAWISVTLALAACQEEISTSDIASSQDGISTSVNTTGLVIHTPAAPQSKVIHGELTEDGTRFDWEKGDKIKVFVTTGENSESYHCVGVNRNETSPEGAFEVTFDTQVTENSWVSEPWTPSVGDKIYALYPYESSMMKSYYVESKDESRNLFGVQLGGVTQVGANNTSHLEISDLMVAKPIELSAEDEIDENGVRNVTMLFAHKLAKVALTVVNNTEKPLDLNALSYVSNLPGDWVSGTMLFDVETGEPVFINEWGVAHSSISTLNIEDVTLAPGASTVLWTWMPELDFSAGNASTPDQMGNTHDERKASILLTTSEGVFRAADVQFSSPFKADLVYKQKFTLTPSKKLDDEYVYVPEMLFPANSNSMVSYYDGEDNVLFRTWGAPVFPVYDLNMRTFDDEAFSPAGGVFVKKSEVAKVKRIELNGFFSSLAGIQAFTNLETLQACLSTDNGLMLLRGVDLSGNTNLKNASIEGLNAEKIDLSMLPLLESITLTSSETAVIKQVVLGTHPSLTYVDIMCESHLDLTRYSTLKKVVAYGSTDLGGLNLDELRIETKNSALVSMPSSITKLCLTSLCPLNAYPVVTHLEVEQYEDDPKYLGLESHIADFAGLEYLKVNKTDRTIVLGAANAGIDTLIINGLGAANVTGMEYLTALTKLELRDLTDSFTFTAPDHLPLEEVYLSDCAGDFVFGTGLPLTSFEAYTVGAITIKGADLLTELIVYETSGTLNLGSMQALETLKVTSTASKSVIFNYAGTDALSYPALKYFYLSDKSETTFPRTGISGFGDMTENDKRAALSALLPSLWGLYFYEGYFPDRGYVKFYTGIASFDLTPYSTLETFHTRNYYYDGSSTKYMAASSITISKAQADYWTTNPNYFNIYVYGSSTSKKYNSTEANELINIHQVPVSSVTLDQTSITMEVGDTKTLTATVLPVDASNKAVTWTSSAPGVASVDDGVVTAWRPGTVTITATAGGQTASCEVTVEGEEPAYVDLGLSSGTLWATRNAGASSVEEVGTYYTWSEHMDVGEGWAVPTKDQLQELISGCTYTSSTYKGVNGVLLTSKANSQTLFIPLGGLQFLMTDSILMKDYMYIWSCTANENDNSKAYSACFTTTQSTLMWVDGNTEVADYGMPVRPVKVN